MIAAALMRFWVHGGLAKWEKGLVVGSRGQDSRGWGGSGD